MYRVLCSTDDSLFTDYLTIEVEVPLAPGVFSASDVVSDLFPGRAQFAQDAKNILQSEYMFDIVNSSESNRADSASIYFDTYFDLNNALPALERVGVINKDIPQGKVHCFIHFRFSDHPLYDAGDRDHIQFVRDNAANYLSSRPADYVYPDESIVLSEQQLQQAYSQALEDLRDDLDIRIVGWVNRARKDASRKASK